MRSLLIVGAHPDDETFFAGGTLAKYAENGTRVSIVCATRGERGSTAGLCSIEELPQVREQELRDVARILGADNVYFLDYEDQKLSAAPIEEVRRQLVEVIRETRPQIVITFDPNGANQHTDHLAISHFTSDAIAAAADHRWYPEIRSPHTVERLLWTPPTLLFRLAPDTDLRNEPGIDFLIDVREWREKKEAAIRAYRTQLPGLGKLFFEDPNGRRTFLTEAFRLAWGPRPQQAPADDLFAR